MRISILTLFPKMFSGPFDYSILKRAVDKNYLEINLVNLRDFGLGRYKVVDDRPYGGGVGMILRVDVLDKAIQKVKRARSKGKTKEKTILLDPKGKLFNQQMAHRFSKIDHLILVCGHYEGVDERVKKLVDEVVSIGDYILTGGEIAALVIVDSVARLVPGVLEKPEAVREESFQILGGRRGSCVPILEYPQYTRPQKYCNMSVPKILLSGNHKKIAAWRKKMAENLTEKLRPNLKAST